MSGSDLEIEYLDEDEDLVQQCIETLQEATPATRTQPSAVITKPSYVVGKQPRHASANPALVKRVCLQNDSDDENPRRHNIRRSTRRKPDDDSDSDYDPSQDNSEDEPIVDDFDEPRRRQTFSKLSKSMDLPSISYSPNVQAKNKMLDIKRTPMKNESEIIKDTGPMALQHSQFISKYQEKFANASSTPKKPKSSGISVTSLEISPNKTETTVKLQRKIATPSRFSIYRSARQGTQDVAFKIFPPQLAEIRLHNYGDSKYMIGAKVISDERTLEKWNSLCRQKIEHYKNERNLKSVKTTQYIKNVKEKKDGKLITVLKLHVETRSADQLDIFQATVPEFEPDVPKIEINFRESAKGANGRNPRKPENVTLLTTETTKDGQVLVAYNATDCRSSTFKMVEDGKVGDEGKRRHIRMLMSCRMCSNCYQYSWRGTKQAKGTKEAKCAICGSSFTSAYNLLTHVRSHDAAEVRQRRQQQIEMLSKIVGYHYKCRLCSYVAKSIKQLRSHLNVHKGVRKFKCEVGQHVST